ncbi:MAG: 4-alpha-glucanotransferase [Synergistaceae bacterium]|jgi:4-alpha-glucanotransferase|nr:4-alpha-glucanotransferase [Synergistaceae bacterium]
MGERIKRAAGVLLHISSLPGPYGSGDFGYSAERFAELLADFGVGAWQMLPLVPVDGAFSYSPYSSQSAFAGSPMFVCPEKLAALGLVAASELEKIKPLPPGRADFDAAIGIKSGILKICRDNFRRGESYKTEFRDLSDKFWRFCADEAYWLEDYALYCVLKDIEGGRPWYEWRPEYRSRDWGALDPLKNVPEISSALDEKRFEQFLFGLQLQELRAYCAGLGVRLIGDLPIYVAHDSADVWGHQELFGLDSEGMPVTVAGVPPDYFSETGQRWGNPIYRWDEMKRDGYAWWLGRFRRALSLADVVRIDHFRGFLQFWEIPASEATAENGRWSPGPGENLFRAMRDSFPRIDGKPPFIAEDLGVITDDVARAMEDFSFPGMKVLQFAFGEGMPQNPYIPHNHRRACVVYAGTHDNDTAAGWWKSGATAEEKRNFLAYTGLENPTPERVADEMTRMALSSTADMAVVTAQDILRLGGEARMNKPSTVDGNWRWRLEDLDAFERELGRVAELNALFGRDI